MYDKHDSAGHYASAAARDAAKGRIDFACKLGIRNLAPAAYRLCRSDARMLARGMQHSQATALLADFDAAAYSIDPRSQKLQHVAAAVADPWGPDGFLRFLGQ